MNKYTSDLVKLRPVTFYYKDHSGDRLEVDLIAEEVTEIDADLVVRGADGKIETIQYQKLTTMRLNELQREHRHGEEQAEKLREQSERIRALEDRLAALERQR
jgi:hypothetical protein